MTIRTGDFIMKDFNTWLNEGLNDKNFPINVTKILPSKVPTGKRFTVPSLFNNKYLKITDTHNLASKGYSAVLCVDLQNFDLVSLRDDLPCYIN